MFYAKGEDAIEEMSEQDPLLPTTPIMMDGYQEYDSPRTWKKFIYGEMRVPRVQTIAGVLLGLLLLGMVLMLVAEAIREAREPDPFLIDYSTSPRPFAKFILEDDRSSKQVWTEGEALVAYRKNLEKVLVQNGIVPALGGPSCLLQRFQKGSADTQGLEDCAIVVEHMKRTLGGCVDIAMLPDHCKAPTPLTCDGSYKYRTFNGSCNNLQHADWGMSLSPFKRMLRPDYADGVSKPRIAKSGQDLPNARYLSNELYTHPTRPKCNCTVLTLYFGLFIDHDIIRITSKSGKGGAPISCCSPEIVDKPSLLHPECMAIGVAKDDPFFGQFGVRCLDFVRSAPVPGECPGQREQMNSVTSFLDASGVYGSFMEKMKHLRSHKNGQLRVMWINKTELLPQAHHIDYRCGFPNKDLYCFRAGDMRANEQVELSAIHTLWMREHNRVANLLHSLNPSWDDDKLFQEGRRIIIAEVQHLVYNEFLPLLLGREKMAEYGLSIDPEKGFRGYDPELNPTMYNVFGGAAFRVGHSLIESTLELIGPMYTREKHIPLHNVFLNPDLLYNKEMDLLVRGMVREKAHSVDSFITDEVRNRLFQPHNGKYGMDLSAIGIQRGRDQGLPGYTKWRQYCNLSEVNSWDNLFDTMDPEHVQRLRKVYNSIEDIDLIPGALSENHLPGALVGPVHACLIAKQFQHTKYGDRFWFETRDQVGSFTPDQLEQLYKSSMARFLCDNSDDIQEFQRWAFRSISDENPVLSCKEIPKVELKPWQEYYP